MFVLFVYRHATADKPDASHVGLGVNCMHSVRVLRRAGIPAEAVGVKDAGDLAAALQARPQATHLIVEAPWIATAALAQVLRGRPELRAAVRCHSQVGFLQVEAGAVRLLRDYIRLAETNHNFDLAGNARRFCEFISTAYHARCPLLPNLYDADRADRKQPPSHGRVIRVGAFGAIRLLKLHVTAAAAALVLGRLHGADVEFHLSVNREEHGKGVLNAIRNFYADLPWAKLVEVPWQDWPSFRRWASHMDVCLQPSATETFNLATADAAAEGVPSVVSEAIEWAPDRWKAPIDDAGEIARTAHALLHYPHAGAEGLAALHRYQAEALSLWRCYLAELF